MVAFYVFLQFCRIDLRLARLVGGDARGAAGPPLFFARLLPGGLVGISRIQFRPAGIAPGDPQGPPELRVGHVRRVPDLRDGAAEGQAVQIPAL